MTRLTFLGTGTSQGIPVIACGCEVCRSEDLRDKRLRSSAMVERNGTRVVIDAGPDFRQQMLREHVNHIDGILLTHEHKDHIAGIDDVRAYNHAMHSAIDIYASERVQQAVMKDFDYAFSEVRYPGAPMINLVTIDPQTPFRVKDMEVVPILGTHYRIPVLGFRIGGIAYLTDFNAIEESEIEKIRGVEILVVNALRHEKHISHFSLPEAVALSSAVGAERTYFTHTSHEMGKYDEITQKLPGNMYFAYDGLVVESKSLHKKA